VSARLLALGLGCALGLGSVLGAQEGVAAPVQPQHRIGLGVSVQHHQLREDLVAPLRFAGPGVSLDLDYDLRVGDSGFQADWRPRLAYALNRHGHESIAIGSELGAAYLHGLVSGGPAGAFHLGGRLSWSWNPHYAVSWDDSHLYWVSAVELGLRAWHELEVATRHRLVVRLDLPLGSLSSRPPPAWDYKVGRLKSAAYWFSRTHSEMRPIFLHQYLHLGVEVEYRFETRPGVEFSVGYGFEAVHHALPESFSSLTHALHLGAGLDPVRGRGAP
jgi:hypothetical protein